MNQPREMCVIFNPAAGRRRAHQRLQAVQKRWSDCAAFWPTQAPGHARELARQAALDGYQTVAAAGGDGTMHEVLNGLLLAQVPGTRLGLIPIGSANDFAFSLDIENSPPIRRIDVGLLRTADGSRAEYFGCCAGLGFNACVTVESRRVRWLQGLLLYGCATLRALVRHFDCQPWEIAFDDQPAETRPTLLFSALNGRREGNFPMAPHASLDDGWLDFAHAGELTRWQVLKLLPKLARSGPPADHPQIQLGRCRRVAIRSPQPLVAHVDGELFCVPADNVCAVVIELLLAALEVDLRFAQPD